MTARRGDVRGTGIVSHGKGGRCRQIDQARKLGAAHEVDRVGAKVTNFDRERLFARGADDDRNDACRLEQAQGEHAVMLRWPALLRVAQR
jgi:hypothetical protein